MSLQWKLVAIYAMFIRGFIVCLLRLVEKRIQQGSSCACTICKAEGGVSGLEGSLSFYGDSCYSRRWYLICTVLRFSFWLCCTLFPIWQREFSCLLSPKKKKKKKRYIILAWLREPTFNQRYNLRKRVADRSPKSIATRYDHSLNRVQEKFGHARNKHGNHTLWPLNGLHSWFNVGADNGH